MISNLVQRPRWQRCLEKVLCLSAIVDASTRALKKVPLTASSQVTPLHRPATRVAIDEGQLRRRSESQDDGGFIDLVEEEFTCTHVSESKGKAPGKSEEAKEKILIGSSKIDGKTVGRTIEPAVGILDLV